MESANSSATIPTETKSKCTCHNADASGFVNDISFGDGSDIYRSWDKTSDSDLSSNAHWGDYKVLKRCLVQRWQDITKIETCLQSLWSKRKYLERTLDESQSQLACSDRSLPALNAAIDALSNEIDQQQQRCRDIDKELAERQAQVAAVVHTTNHAHSASCPCRRLSQPVGVGSGNSLHIRSLMSPMSGLKSQQSDTKRHLDTLQAQLNCKLSERLINASKKEDLDKLIQQVKRDLLAVNEECQLVTNRWKEYRCQVEKLQTQMEEQWGPSALDRLIPANASRSRFF